MNIKDLRVRKAGEGNGAHPGDLLITVPYGEEIFACKVTKRSMFISTQGFYQEVPVLRMSVPPDTEALIDRGRGDN